MRILIISESFTAGGLETQIEGQVRVLNKEGVETFLVTGTQENEISGGDMFGEPPVSLPMKGNITAAELVKTLDAIHDLIGKWNISLIHAHPFTSLVIGFLAAERAGLPLVVTLHGPASLRKSYGPLYDFALRSSALPNSARVFCVSQEVEVMCRSIANCQTEVLPNAVASNHPIHSVNSEGRWAWAGRVDSEKLPGLIDFIQKADGLPVNELHIYGDGPAMPELVSFLGSRSGQSPLVHLMGWMPDFAHRLRDYSGVAGMGRVILEAANAGLPCLLVGYDGVKGLLDRPALEWATFWNLSGRGSTTLGPDELAIQFQRLSRRGDEFQLHEWIATHCDETTIWRSYLDRVQSLPAVETGADSGLREVLTLLGQREVQVWSDPGAFDLVLGRARHSKLHCKNMSELVIDSLIEKSAAQSAAAVEAFNGRLKEAFRERDEALSREREKFEQELARVECTKAATEAVAQREREKVTELQQCLIAEREELARLGAEVIQLRSEAADRNYWEYRARSLENSTSWRVTSGGRSLKTAAVFALQPGQLAKRFKHLRELTRTRGLSAAGAWLWRRLSEGQGQRTPTSGVRSTNCLTAADPTYDIHKDGRSDELKTYLRERSYAGIFVMGSRHMGWHEVFKQRHHHIADFLMSKGYLVLCAMNPIYPEDCTAGIKQDSENLFLVNFDDRQIWAQIIELLAVESKAALYYHLVGTEPGTTFEEIHKLKRLGFVLVYDYFDEVAKDIYPDLSDFCIARHKALLRDEEILVLTSADNLLRKATDRRSRNLICAPNGVRLEDWLLEDNAPIPEEIAGVVAEGKPIVGYYGSFATWMNYDYIHALSRSRSDVNIVMIGYDYEWGRGAFTRSRISELPNVHLVPAQKYYNLKYFSRFFNVGIIPFRDYELTKSVSPVKMFEYMAQGIPIVASGLEECRKYASCLIAESAEDFVDKVGRALTLKDDAAYMKQLRKEAEANTWAARGEMIETAMTAMTTTETGKLLTITVPTYNMEAFLPRCLDSILPPSQLQRLEIIIVNDGSKDGSLTIARQYEARFPHVVRVIDKPNGGHGSALNAGIREAKGKYFKVVDADDWLDLTDLVAHMAFLARHDADMAVTNYMRTYDDRLGELVLYSDRLKKTEYARDEFYRALMADASYLSYAHMHAISYRTKILQDNHILITEKSFYVDQEYIAFPQKFVESVRYQDIVLYRYYNGRSGQSIAPDVARKRAPENYKILQNIIAYCDALPRDSEIRAYIINIAYHQSWFYLTVSDDDKSKRDIIHWWKENNSRYFKLLNEQFCIVRLEAAQ